jgi:branched-chain amino acid transport system substrate-binding protein
MISRRRVAFLWLFASVTLVLSRCSTETKSPIVGAILAQTGNSNFIGKPEKDVLETLLTDYNSNQQNPFGVSLDIRDSAGDPNTAVALFKRLANNPQVIAVIGPSTSGESLAVAVEAEKLGMPLLSLAASRKIVIDDHDRTRPWIFKFAQNDDLAARRLLNAIAARGDSRVALLFEDNGFGKSGADVFRKSIRNTSLALVHDVPFPPSLDAPEPFISAIPASAQAIVIWGTAPGPALLAKALGGRGSPVHIYLSHGDASEEFLASAGPAAEGAVIVGSRVLMEPRFLDTSNPADATILRFRSFWQSHFKTPPSHFAGHARDALEAIRTTLSSDVLSGDTMARRKKLRDALETLAHFSGVTGTFTFSESDHAGLTIDAFQTYSIEASHFVPFLGKK